MKKAVLGLVALLVVVLGVCLVRAATASSRQVPASAAEPATIDADLAARHLAGAIRFSTVSDQDATKTRADQLAGLRAYLAQTYPKLHAAAPPEAVAEHSLLYTWKGSDPSLPPLLLLAHMDVVPVEAATEGQWAHPVFEGAIADGYVWGRGAMDDKGPLIEQLEAAELLLGEGFAPKRTVLFAFGHNEEVGGASAKELARLLESRGVKAEVVLDEGMAIVSGVVPATSKPVALIGLAEKGYLSLELTSSSEGGHSSTPPPQTTIGVLAQALDRLEQNPFPATLDGAPRLLFDYVGPEADGFGDRLVLNNLWLTAPLVVSKMASAPRTNAMLRTTTAPTLFEAGVKENVLPTKSRAVVNFRIRPGETIETVVARVKETIHDERVTVAVLEATKADPSPTSPVDSAAFQTVQATIRQVFPEAIVAPTLVLGATDARHYTGVSSNVYRFVPAQLTADDLKRVHSIDERLSVKALGDAVKWYRQYFKNAAGQ